MAKLILVRHAQASFGADDYDNLSDLGHVQSELLGQYFKSRGVNFDLIITGNMKRHKQTAAGILKHAENNESIHKQQMVDSSWDEFDFQTIVSSFLQRNSAMSPAKNAPRKEWYRVLRLAMIAWSNDQLCPAPQESWLSFNERVIKGANSILSTDAKTVLVVSSGGAMAMFLRSIFNASVEQAVSFNLQIKNTSVNEFYFNTDGFQLASFNNVPHLDTQEHISKITYS